MHPDFINIGTNLADELYSAGFSYVVCRRGMHITTYKISVEFFGIMDISFIPNDVYQKLLSESLIIDNLYYIDPKYIKSDLYCNCAQNFFSDSWRINKALKRIELLEKYFPNIIDKDVTNIKKNKSQRIKKGGMISNEIYVCDIECPEIYSFRPIEFIKKISKNYDKFKVINKVISYLHYSNNYYECYNDDKLLYKIYYINVPVRVIEKKYDTKDFNINYCSSYYLYLMHLYIKLWIINNDNVTISKMINKKLGETIEKDYEIIFDIDMETINEQIKFIPPTYRPGKDLKKNINYSKESIIINEIKL